MTNCALVFDADGTLADRQAAATHVALHPDRADPKMRRIIGEDVGYGLALEGKCRRCRALDGDERLIIPCARLTLHV